MKRNILALLLSFTTLTVLAQNQETRQVDDFSYVYSGIKADVLLRQGNKTAVVLEGDAETLARVETYVAGNKLKIKYEKNNWRNNRKIKVYITVKAFSGAAVGGSGYIHNEGTLKGNDVSLAVSGSGSIDLALEAKEVNCSISGSGDINLQGKGKVGELSISGSGKLDAVDFEVETMEITISGSGNAAVYATKEINSRISGSGTVSFKGNPEKVYNHSSGSGKLKRING